LYLLQNSSIKEFFWRVTLFWTMYINSFPPAKRIHKLYKLSVIRTKRAMLFAEMIFPKMCYFKTPLLGKNTQCQWCMNLWVWSKWRENTEVPGEGHVMTPRYLPQITKNRPFFFVNYAEHKKCGQNLKFHTPKLANAYGKVRKVRKVFSITKIFLY
jgi:hypothetical protein